MQSDSGPIKVEVFGDEINTDSGSVGRIELVFDEPVDNGAFSNSLISYEDKLALTDILFTGCITDFFVLFFGFLDAFHFLYVISCGI